MSEANAVLIFHMEGSDSANCCLPTQWGPFPYASHSRNAYRKCRNGGRSKCMGPSSLRCYSLTGTQKELLWLDICPLLPLPLHHLDEYIRKQLVSTYEKVKGEESGTCIERGWQRKKVSACCHIYSLIPINQFICTCPAFFLFYWGLVRHNWIQILKISVCSYKYLKNGSKNLVSRTEFRWVTHET
jgi:hypothetical protein